MAPLTRALAPAVLLALLATDAPRPHQPIAARAPIEVLASGFDDLAGIAIGQAGDVFVADRAAGTVTRLAVDHPQTVVASRLDRPTGLAVDTAGRLLVAEEGAGRVVRLQADGRHATLAIGIVRPRWLAIGHGAVYIAARRIAEEAETRRDNESAAGDAILVSGADGRLRVFADGFGHLEGLVAADGAVYAVTAGRPDGAPGHGTIVRLAVLADGRAGAPIPLGPRGQLTKAVGLARDRLGALYLTAAAVETGEDRVKRAIAKLRPESPLTAFAWALDDPQGVAFDGAGHLYVADGRSGRVIRFRAPPPPSLSPLPAFTSQAPLVVSGSTEAGARVDAFLDEATTPVTTSADGAGAFALTASLTPEGENTLRVVATTHGGEGLASDAARATITHDGVPPAVVFQAPAAGGVVRAAVSVQARASDDGSLVATFTLSTAGRTLAAATAPALPAPASTVAATWDTTTAPDGTHTLRATATDRANNATTVSRVLLVDNTPPDTVIAGGPAGSTPATTVTFSFTGSDNLTPVAGLEFAWRLDGGPWSPFAVVATATVSDLVPGPHLFEVKARDQAGNEDPWPASRAFAVSRLRVRITEPGEGASVPAGLLLVRGVLEGAAPETSVAVNGFVAAVQGPAFAVQVPLTGDTTTLTAIATSVGGPAADHRVSIAVSGLAPALTVTPSGGLAPLPVVFGVLGVGVSGVTLDLEGDGTVDFAGPTLDGQVFTYPQPGLYVPVASVTDTRGSRFTVTTVVHVEDPAAVTGRFQGLWRGFRARLQIGDQAGALAHIAAPLRPRLEGVFQALGSALASVAGSLEDLEVLAIAEGLAETAIVRRDSAGPRLYFVYFRRDGLGRWLIEEM